MPLSLRLLFTVGLVSVPLAAGAQVPVTAAGVPVTENFNTLTAGSTVSGAFLTGVQAAVPGLTGWSGLNLGGVGPVNTGSTFGPDDGNGSFAGLYSYGTVGSSDRALGSLAQNTSYAYGAEFINSTGALVYQVAISYTAEWWRTPTGGVNSVIVTVGFGDDGIVGSSYLAADLTTQVIPLNISPPGTTPGGSQPRDGNAASNRVVRTTTLLNVNWNPGESFFIRWQDVDNSGSDAGIAIDDFSLTAVPEPAATVAVAGAALAVALAGRRRRS